MKSCNSWHQVLKNYEEAKAVLEEKEKEMKKISKQHATLEAECNKLRSAVIDLEENCKAMSATVKENQMKMKSWKSKVRHITSHIPTSVRARAHTHTHTHTTTTTTITTTNAHLAAPSLFLSLARLILTPHTHACTHFLCCLGCQAQAAQGWL
jgi:septal ring factor EnvC (AmiA/AmiB activator)